MNKISGKTRLFTTATTLGLFLALVGTSSPSIAVEDAAGVYKAKCAICHAMDGSGNTMNGKKLNVKDLRRDEVKKMTDAQLLQIISKGKNKMPAYEQALGKDMCNQLVAYTRALAKK